MRYVSRCAANRWVFTPIYKSIPVRALQVYTSLCGCIRSACWILNILPVSCYNNAWISWLNGAFLSVADCYRLSARKPSRKKWWIRRLSKVCMNIVCLLWPWKKTLKTRSTRRPQTSAWTVDLAKLSLLALSHSGKNFAKIFLKFVDPDHIVKPVKFSCHLVWSPCKIWLLFVIPCGRTLVPKVFLGRALGPSPRRMEIVSAAPSLGHFYLCNI